MSKIFLMVSLVLLMAVKNISAQYHMPPETGMHEGTWLQWPHNYTYGAGYAEYVEASWIEMTRQLIKGENVHIIVYNTDELTRIEELLISATVDLTKVDFFVHPTDDFWVRDNGPLFVFDETNTLKITDWGFDGWGNDFPFDFDNVIPQLVGGDIDVDVIDVSDVELEGGAVENDGNGTFIGTKSSILGDNRNPGLNTGDIEDYLNQYLGFTNFIWLDGYYGGAFDPTDSHIDGFVKFIDTSTIVTMDSTDLIYWGSSPEDISTIYSAKNTHNLSYNFTYLPLTKENVHTTDGINIGYKSSYINYYVGNAVVLVPTFNDDNDTLALSLIEPMYPGREVVGIDCRNILIGGGMIHCVTQQQPAAIATSINSIGNPDVRLYQNYPNPFSASTTIQFSIAKNASVQLAVFSMNGERVATLIDKTVAPGTYSFSVNGAELSPGTYVYTLLIDNIYAQVNYMEIVR